MVRGPPEPVGHVKKISGHETSLRGWAHPQDPLVNETLIDRKNGTARRVFSLCAIIDSYLAPERCPAQDGSRRWIAALSSRPLETPASKPKCASPAQALPRQPRTLFMVNPSAWREAPNRAMNWPCGTCSKHETRAPRSSDREDRGRAPADPQRRSAVVGASRSRPRAAPSIGTARPRWPERTGEARSPGQLTRFALLLKE